MTFAHLYFRELEARNFMEHVIFSIDIGTTNLKINLFDQQDHLIEALTMTLKNTNITDTLFEVDIEEILEYVKSGLEELRHKYEVKSGDIVLTTAMHSIQLLEKSHIFKGKTMTWADKRGSTALSELGAAEKEARYLRTGTPNHTMNPFYKLVEMADQLGEGVKIGSLKDVIFQRLSGEWAIDVSNASASGLFNIEELSWDGASLSELGLSEAQLPIVRPINYTKPLKLADWGADFRVIIGTSDGVSSNLTFKNLTGAAILSVGTSHAVRVVSSAPELNPSLGNFSYVIDEGRYLTGLASNNGASVLQWVREMMRVEFWELEQVAQARPLTTAVFLPFLMGERAPLWDEQATASFLGLTRNLSRESLIYAVILGMCFNIKQNVKALEQLVAFEKIGLVGGVTQMPSVVQLLADVLGKPLYIPNLKNAETLGSVQAVRPVKVEINYTVVAPNRDKNLVAYEARYKNALEEYQKNKREG